MDVHPAADIFPMMTEEELRDLAADIAEHGLLHPIVLDADGTLIDGRNRLRACEIAGIEPTFTRLNGHDAKAFIVSANLARRNLNKGQQAMALAMIYPDGGKGGRGNRGNPAETAAFSERRLRDARMLLRHSRALSEDVLADRIRIDVALEQMREERERSASAAGQLAELHEHAPDLAELVSEDRLTLEEAHAAYKQRVAEAVAAEANKRETMLRLGAAALHATTAWASEVFTAELVERLADEEFRRQWLERVRCDQGRVSEIARGAAAFIAMVETILKGEAGDV